MKNLLLSICVLILTVSASYAVQCGPAEPAIEMVTGPKYNEKLYEKTDKGVYVFGNCDTGTFTMFVDAPESVKPPEHKGEPGLCLVSMGNSFKDSPYCNRENI